MHTQNHGAIAQLVEQRTENPCVPGSIPGGTTKKDRICGLFLFELAQPLGNDSLEHPFHFVWQEREVDKLKPLIFCLCKFGAHLQKLGG